MSKPVLQARGITKTYHDGSRTLEILRGIDLQIDAGEALAIIGRSGTGKTTFLNCIGLLDRPTAGEIQVNGEAVTGLSEGRRTRIRARHIGFVFQHYHLLSEFTALENVALAGSIVGRPDPKRAAELLGLVGLQERVHHRPRQLSGGEQQRVAIARALMPEPSLLLCDEPTGNLDPATGTEVMNVLWNVVREKKATMILVTHDKEVSQNAHRMLELQSGRLA